MRVFVAVDIDENVLGAIGEVQSQLQAEAGLNEKSVKWVRPELMHLTLKFLGEVKDKNITDVCKAVEMAAEKHKKFELDIEELGCFGGRSARVVWVGCGNGGEKLSRLAEDVDEQFSEAGFAKETRRFTGHLTLCRIKNVKCGFTLADAVRRFGPFRAGTTGVDAITVYQSELTRSGPNYTVLANYRLQQ